MITRAVVRTTVIYDFVAGKKLPTVDERYKNILFETGCHSTELNEKTKVKYTVKIHWDWHFLTFSNWLFFSII